MIIHEPVLIFLLPEPPPPPTNPSSVYPPSKPLDIGNALINDNVVFVIPLVICLLVGLFLSLALS
jgi:hypothetical protein